MKLEDPCMQIFFSFFFLSFFQVFLIPRISMTDGDWTCWSSRPRFEKNSHKSQCKGSTYVGCEGVATSHSTVLDWSSWSPRCRKSCSQRCWVSRDVSWGKLRIRCSLGPMCWECLWGRVWGDRFPIAVCIQVVSDFKETLEIDRLGVLSSSVHYGVLVASFVDFFFFFIWLVIMDKVFF